MARRHLFPTDGTAGPPGAGYPDVKRTWTCEQACNFGSESISVQLGGSFLSGRCNESGSEQVDVRPAIHLTFQGLETIDLALGLPV